MIEVDETPVKPDKDDAVAPKDTLVEPIVTLEFVSLLLAIDPANIVLVTVPVSPVVTIVPATAGTLILNDDAVLGPTKLT